MSAVRKSAPALLLLGCTLPALAQQSPYYLGGSLGVTQVSNLYRTPEGQPRNNDTVTTASLLAGLDQRLGRQRLFGDVSLRHNRYKNNRSLGNDAYGLNAGLDWQTVNRLSGQFSVGSNRSLAPFNPGNAPAITRKNIEQADQARVSLRYGLLSLLSLDASLQHRRRDYSAVEYDPYDYRQDTLSLGLNYRPSALLRLGIALRHGEGKYPHYRKVGATYQAEDFTTRSVDLTGDWTASGASTLSARLSASKRDHSAAGARDFSGATGSLSWRWQPSAKLLINTSLTRDTGDESSFFSLGTIGGIANDYSRLTNSLQVNASYELSGKLLLDAGLSYADRDLSNSFGSSRTESGDRSTSLSLGGRWLFSRSGLLGCNINHDTRSGQSALSTPYSANSYGCYAQLTLR